MIVGAPHCGFSPVHVLGNQQFIEIQLNQLKILQDTTPNLERNNIPPYRTPLSQITLRLINFLKPLLDHAINLLRRLPQRPMTRRNRLPRHVCYVLLHSFRHSWWQSLVFCCLDEEDWDVDCLLGESARVS